MKSKTRFSKAKERGDIYHSGFYRYIQISYRKLVEKLGEPNDCVTYGKEWYSSDGKVRVIWVFKDSNKKHPTVVTIYDYKDDTPIKHIREWHVGSKGDRSKVDEFLQSSLEIAPRDE